MVMVDALHGESAAAVADELFGGGTGSADLQAFFDHAALEVKASGGGGEEGEEELEWLSNKDAFPAVETMAPAGARPRTKAVRRPRRVVAWSTEGRQCRHCGTVETPQWRDGPEGRRTLCNACGVRYRTGRLLPEYRPLKSPTFSPELHSNRHRRVVELRRRGQDSIKASPATAGDGEEGGEELGWLSNKDAFPAMEMMVPTGARPRTKGVRRPRRVVAWSPPPPPRTPAAAARRQWSRRGGGAGVAVEQGSVPDVGDDGASGSATAGEGRAVAPAGRRCQHCGTEETPQWRVGPEGRRTLCNACGVQYRGGRLVPEYRPLNSPTFSPALHSNIRSRVIEMCRRREESAKAFPAADSAM
ncbi:GATA transcription factor 1-like [Phragmites australis]|uniref:GATA transcription factor 1-like n=1 Tax=Phragmites australis TaxID=29695 RepID=UPI002D779923|nr:GATA transcription factor 1-like [Phragmites australis]